VRVEREVDRESMSVKEALSLLTTLQSSQVLPVLRHADYVMLAGLAFQGFRMDTGGYANPIVRRRLAEEAAKNPQFAGRLRELASAPPAPVPVQASKPAQPAKPANGTVEIEKYRLERERLKHERDAAITARQSAERQLAEAKRDLIGVRAEKSEADREIERLKQRIERSERKQRQLETTNAALRKAAIQTPPVISVSTIRDASPTKPAVTEISYFADAVRHLLGKDKEIVALSLAEDVLRAHAGDIDALEIKADALVKMDKPREAVPVLRSVVTGNLMRNAVQRAGSGLYKLMMISSRPDQETKLVRDYLIALGQSTADMRENAEPVAALRIDNPVAFHLVKSLSPASVKQIAFPEQTTYPPDAPLPLTLSSTTGVVITPRRLILAVDRNDWAIVELTQEALRQKDDDEKTKILLSITQAADGDDAYARVLAPKFSRGAVIVDASNVAWHGQEVLTQPQPRLDYILAIRRSLRERGYFPVLLIADANLPYVINEPAAVRKLVEEDQIQLVISGSDADEQILRDAARLNAPIVSNDYMSDWDPHQKVLKIQYSFTPDGRATIFF
jgi:hypothetical protein